METIKITGNKIYKKTERLTVINKTVFFEVEPFGFVVFDFNNRRVHLNNFIKNAEIEKFLTHEYEEFKELAERLFSGIALREILKTGIEMFEHPIKDIRP